MINSKLETLIAATIELNCEMIVDKLFYDVISLNLSRDVLLN